MGQKRQVQGNNILEQLCISVLDEGLNIQAFKIEVGEKAFYEIQMLPGFTPVLPFNIWMEQTEEFKMGFRGIFYYIGELSVFKNNNLNEYVVLLSGEDVEFSGQWKRRIK